MKRSRFTEEQIIGVLKEGEAGVQAEEICRQHGICAQTYYRWKAKYGGKFVKRDANGKIISMDCTGFLSLAVADATGAAYTKYGRPDVKQGAGIFYPVASPHAGDVIMFETPGHVGVVTNISPFKFAGSQSSSGPAEVDYSDKTHTYWPDHMSGVTYYEVCVPDGPTSPSPSLPNFRVEIPDPGSYMAMLVWAAQTLYYDEFEIMEIMKEQSMPFVSEGGFGPGYTNVTSRICGPDNCGVTIPPGTVPPGL